MSTEAKIKHTAGQQLDAALDRIERRLEIAEARNEQLIKMLAAASKKLDRNHRLLEAGEKMAEMAKTLLAAHTYCRECAHEATLASLSNAVAAYQEAAKV